MQTMRFETRYPLPLNELLLAPVVFRASLPELQGAPPATAAGMKDLAVFAGHASGAIRTAMSRLRGSGLVEVTGGGYRLAGMARSLSQVVLAKPTRPDGFLLAVFSFTADDVRERQVVRDALRLHGFQKLAQNAYLNGQVDTSALEAVLDEEGLSDHVFLFRCADLDDPKLRRKLTALFDLPKRAKALSQFHDDLVAYLEAPKLDDATFARRFLYAGPVHYRITFTEEPPLPARYLPEGYPIDRLVAAMPRIAKARAKALARYYEAVNQ